MENNNNASKLTYNLYIYLIGHTHTHICIHRKALARNIYENHICVQKLVLFRELRERERERESKRECGQIFFMLFVKDFYLFTFCISITGTVFS